MAEKDYSEKKLEEFNDVFADIVNVLLFNGERRVKEEELETGMARTSYRVEGKHEEQERDVIKYWQDGQFRIAAYAFENQTGEDEHFPVRGIAYDGANYRDQIRIRDDIRRSNVKRKMGGMATLPLPDFYPVVTLVLYFGDRRWQGSAHLKDHLKIPAGLEACVPDYTVQVFDIAYLSDELVGKFHSDFRIVAEYFVGNRKVKEGLIRQIRFSDIEMKHFSEVMDLLHAVTNSQVFTEIKIVASAEGSVKSMWKTYFDHLLDQGIAEGRAEGKAEGRAEGEARGEARGKEETSLNDIRNVMEGFKVTAQQAMDVLKIPPAEREKYLARL